MAVVAVRWLKELVRRERDVLFFELTSRSTLAFCLSMIFSKEPVCTFPDHALGECVEQSLCLSQIVGMEALGVPIVDRRE